MYTPLYNFSKRSGNTVGMSKPPPATTEIGDQERSHKKLKTFIFCPKKVKVVKRIGYYPVDNVYHAYCIWVQKVIIISTF